MHIVVSAAIQLKEDEDVLSPFYPMYFRFQDKITHKQVVTANCTLISGIIKPGVFVLGIEQQNQANFNTWKPC